MRRSRPFRGRGLRSLRRRPGSAQVKAQRSGAARDDVVGGMHNHPRNGIIPPIRLALHTARPTRVLARGGCGVSRPGPAKTLRLAAHPGDTEIGMNKLRLDLEELRVESFDTAHPEDEKGTVH